MRTTVTFADDVTAAIARLRRERSLGLSDAVNELIRAGMAEPRERKPYVHETHDLGAGPDTTNIGEIEELMDRFDSRYF